MYTPGVEEILALRALSRKRGYSEFHTTKRFKAFTQACQTVYGVAPGAYREKPMPVALRIDIVPFDRVFSDMGEIGMVKFTGQIMVYSNGPDGGKADCYMTDVPRTAWHGARLASSYSGVMPPQMRLINVPEAEYLVFGHGLRR